MVFLGQAPLLTILLLLWASFHLVPASNREEFSQELLHRDSPRSPYYKAFASAFDWLRAATYRSLSRAQSQSNKQDNYLSFTSMMFDEDLTYFVPVSLGNPPYWASLMVNTGSSLTWVHCEPSTGHLFQPDSLHHKFNPDTSSTYQAISSESATCTQIPHLTAGVQMSTDDTCHYRTDYLDGSNSQGILFSDTLGTNGTTSYLIPNITFGCSHKTEGLQHYANIQGVVGLSPGPSSLVTQLGTTIGRKFSYCFAAEPSSPSMLNFGNKAIVTGGVSTPLIVGSHHYYITLDDIVIGDGKGGADDKITVRTRGSPRGNVLIESGSLFTYLDVTIVQQLERKLSAAIKLPRTMPPPAYFRLCFNTSAYELFDFPDMLFRFAGRASLRLKPYNTFVVAVEGVVCLSILPRTYRTDFPSILGSLAQQNFHIGYDLEAKKLSFAPTNCTQMAVGSRN